MKILVFGAGVIGTTYAWQLSEAGCDVSLLVRKIRQVRYSHSGVNISCTDMRGKKTKNVQTVFRPRTVDRLDPKDAYDLIIVTVRNTQFNDVLPYIAKNSGDSHILFFGHFWNEFSTISKHLPAGRYFFGFPGMAGGGRSDNGINCFLFGNGNTMLGEPDGKQTRRLRDTALIMGKADMRPKISGKIIPWLKTNYVWPAASFGAICKAGSARAFAANNGMIRQSAMAIREGLRVCEKKGVRPSGIFPFVLFYLPAFFVVPFLKRAYRQEMQQAMDGHIKHGFDEMKKQYYDLFHEARRLKIDMPHYNSYEKYILQAEKNRPVHA